MVKRVLIAFLLLDSIAIFGIWAISLTSGAFEESLLTYQLQGTVPAGHLVAEFLMASVTLAGAIGWGVGARWGRGLTLFGLGMFTYSSINSLGWALYNDPAVAIPMVLTLGVAAVAVPYLMRHEKVNQTVCCL
ncbi:MAG TPA: hypothetical protein EYH31_14185 [Anaerolineae bacterium]|nr:hypothetical protein [Anaerolineae bacterium]